jgi:alkanesulfonate monooxygenase SsuD/methylene tetrahydromethanopterin reductase-like flavin-dependent oxidoreductase (luciferase family)
VAGDGEEMVEHLEALAARGIERAYLWFTDFADEEGLLRFGEEVLPRVR